MSADLSDSFIPRTVTLHGKTPARSRYVEAQQSFVIRHVSKKWRWWLAIKLYRVKKTWRTWTGTFPHKRRQKNPYRGTAYAGPTFALGTLRKAKRINEANGMKPVQVLHEGDPGWTEPNPSRDFGPWGA